MAYVQMLRPRRRPPCPTGDQSRPPCLRLHHGRTNKLEPAQTRLRHCAAGSPAASLFGVLASQGQGRREQPPSGFGAARAHRPGWRSSTTTKSMRLSRNRPSFAGVARPLRTPRPGYSTLVLSRQPNSRTTWRMPCLQPVLYPQRGTSSCTRRAVACALRRTTSAAAAAAARSGVGWALLSYQGSDNATAKAQGEPRCAVASASAC